MTAKRKIVALVVAVGAAAMLLAAGFWAGHSGVGSKALPEILHGTVVAVGGDPMSSSAVDEFGVRLDGSPAAKSYGLGHVLWTDANGSVNDGAAPTCVAVGRHIAFGVVYFTYRDLMTGQVVWVDCRG